MGSVGLLALSHAMVWVLHGGSLSATINLCFHQLLFCLDNLIDLFSAKIPD